MQCNAVELTNTLEVFPSAGTQNNPAQVINMPGTEIIDNVIEYFAALYGDTTGFLTIWDKQTKQTRWFSSEQKAEAARICLALANKGLDVYYGVGLQQKGLSHTTRGTASTVGALTCLWVDIDIAGAGHSSDNLPTTAEEALEIIKAIPFPPSIVIHSGGGLHVYWLFNEPWILTNQEEQKEAQELSANFQLALRQEAKRHGWTLDNTADLARVLRVPFTKNFKNPEHPRDVVILNADYSLRYNPHQFASLVREEQRTAEDLANRLSVKVPGNVEDIVNNCRFIKHCRDEYKNLSEPHWHAMISVLHDLDGGHELIHKFSDNYPGGSWQQTEQKIQAVKSSGLPCSCEYIKNQLGFNCPEGSCKVAGPISFATNTAVVARLRITDLLPTILENPALCFEKDILKWLAILYQSDPLEWARFKSKIQGKINVTDLKRAIKQLKTVETRLDTNTESGFFSSLTDNGNAERFVALYGDQLRYCNQNHKWYLWDGKRWIEDSTQQVKVLATESINRVAERARTELTGDERHDFLKWCERSKSNSAVKAMVEMAQYGKGIPVRLDEFDKDPFLINCQNGTLNLKTSELQPHQQSDLISKIIPCDYDFEAQCPRWEDFLETALNNDQTAIEFLATIVGITLSGSLLKKFFFVYGKPDTGKSLFIELCHFLMGDYGKGISMDMLMAHKFANAGAPNPELVRLQGARAVYASETTDGRHMDEALVKRITGGDVITVRPLYGEPVDFIPHYKLWLHGNHKPDIQGDDTAIWNRLILIPFMNVIPKDKQDPDLLDKFKAELPGILAWAVRGFQAWIAAGMKLEIPEGFKQEADTYQASMDTLGLFIEELCIVGPDQLVQPSILYANYRDWCQENGSYPLKSAKFVTRMQERGYEQGRTKTGRFWKGITINTFQSDVGQQLSMLAADQIIGSRVEPAIVSNGNCGLNKTSVKVDLTGPF